MCCDEYEKNAKPALLWGKYSILYAVACETAFLFIDCQYIFFILAGGGQKRIKTQWASLNLTYSLCYDFCFETAMTQTVNTITENNGNTNFSEFSTSVLVAEC